MRNFLLVFLVSILSGCAKTYLPVNNVVTVNSTFPGASGLDVYAGKRANGEDVPAYRGDQLVEVRSFVKRFDKGAKRKKTVEFTGAKCELTGTGFKAAFTTPSKVRLPIYGNESSELAIRCISEGRDPVLVTRRAYNKTKTDRLNHSASAGLLGVVAMGTINAMSNDKKHVFLYPPIWVTFNE